MFVISWHRNKADRQTSLIIGLYYVLSKITLRYAEPPVQQPNSELLNDYPSILLQTGPFSTIAAGVTHNLEAMGSLAFSRHGRLAPDNFRLSRTECLYIFEMGIMRPSIGSWGSSFT